MERICTRVGIPEAITTPVAGADDVKDQAEGFGEELSTCNSDVAFTMRELVAIRTAADAAGLNAAEYVEALSQALHAASQITDACTEICDGLLDDAEYVRSEAADHVRLGTGPGTLPTLVRALLALMNAKH